MTSHTKGKVFEEDPDFDKALKELRIAWKGGKSASADAKSKVVNKILSPGCTKKAAEAIMALKTTKTGAGLDPAADQKYDIFLAAGPSIMYEAEQLVRDLNSMLGEAAMSQSLWASMMSTRQATFDYIKQFEGYYDNAEMGDPISTACALGELATSYKAPLAGFVTGIGAKSRISKLLTISEGNENKEMWAFGYLHSSLKDAPNTKKKAAATTNILEASVSLEGGTRFRAAFLNELKADLVDPENNLTNLGLKVSAKLCKINEKERRGPLKTLYSEFKEDLQPPKEEARVQIERTMLYEPTSWVSSLQSEEEVDHKSINLSFFKDQPPHVLLNSALVLADAEVSEANEITRNILACKILLPIGREFLVQGKSLSVPPTQEDLLERIKQIANQPEVKEKVAEYYRVTEDRINATIAKRLLLLYKEVGVSRLAEEEQEVTEGEQGFFDGRLSEDPGTLPEEPAQPEESETLDGETGTEQADLIHVPGIGLVTREELESIEWKPVGSVSAEEEDTEADSYTDDEVQEGTGPEEVEEPTKAEEILDSVYVPEAKIFSVLEEAEPLLEEIASDELAMHERTLAVYELLKLLEIDEKSPQKLVLELAALTNDEGSGLSTKATAAMLSLPHVSDHNWSPRRNSSLLVSVLAAASHNSSNPVIEEKLLLGSETEKDYAIDVLAERFRFYRGQFIDARLTPQELALKELESYTTIHMEYAGFSRLVLAFSDMDVSQESLFHYLELAREANPEGIDSVLLDTLNSYRSQMPGNIFPDASEEYYTKEEATLAEEFLYYIGEGEDSVRELSIAAAVSNIESKAAVEFALQRLHDSEVGDHTTAWAVVLQQAKAWETDTMIMDTFPELEPEKQAAAITALSRRELTFENAEFILEASHSKNIPVATVAGRALMDMDLSVISSENEFTILYGMRNHPNKFLSDLALKRMQKFLTETNEIVSAENVEGLSNIYLDDKDPQLRELAEEALLTNPSDFINDVSTNSLLSSLGKEDIAPTLSMYEIAKQMRSEDIDCEAISAAVEGFERQDNTVALTQLMTAAYTSGEKEHIERVLVPCLGMDEVVSQMAAEFLLNLGDTGKTVILTSAKRENHPDNIFHERGKRIADKSLRLLLKIEAYDLVIPLLAYPYEPVRSSAYDLLEAAPDSSEKTSALLAAFSSDEDKVKLSALNLLPKQETHADRILSLVDDESKEVSVRAAEVAASLITPERLILFLAHDHDSEFVRQRVADAILQNHPEKLEDLSSYLEKEDTMVLTDRQTILSTLRFFQHPKTLHHFFRFRGEADEEEMTTIDNALSYFCETLSGTTSGRIEDPTEEDMHLLLEAYKRFDQVEVHNAILAASKGPSAKLMINAALNSKDPDLLLSATDIFLSIGNLQHAVQLARELQKNGPENLNLALTKPYQQILFGGQLDKMGEIISPVEDPDADPILYRFLKEMVTIEFLNGRGSNESAELFLEFMGTFGDMEGFFDHGLESISELIWASRADPEVDYDAVRKLPDRMPHNLVVEAQLLLDVLMLDKCSMLDKTKISIEAKNILVEHGLRRAVEALEGNWLKSDAEKENSKKKFSLLAELMERGMATEKEVLSFIDPQHPIVCALGASSDWWDEDTVNEGLSMLEEVRAGICEAQSTARKLRKMRAELGPMNPDEVSPDTARADASKVGRSRVPPPSRDGKQIQPKRPERGPSSIPPKK